MSAIKNLKKAYQSMSITRDDFSLQDYLAANKDKDGNAIMDVVGLECKYVPASGERQSEYRTRFFLKNGKTVGTFSGGAHRFFQFYQQILGYEGDKPFLHIDIDGVIRVVVSRLALDGSKSTYNFDLLEEGSELQGFRDYLPNSQNILQLGDGSQVNVETGEKVDE